MNLPQHGKYEWLPTLYNLVKQIKPSNIVEFGPGRGQTTITIALALKELGDGHIYSHDIWNSEYWGEMSKTIDEFKRWGVNDLITLKKLNFYDWVKLSDKKFDMLYFDIDNNGDKLLDLYYGVKENIDNGAVVLFEGGSQERDNYVLNGKKMNDVKGEVGYELLTSNVKYSFSVIYNKDLYDMEF